MNEKEKKEKLSRFSSGIAADAYQLLGAHTEKGKTVFRVWAPTARAVAVVGDFNGWQGDEMHPIGGGVFEGVTTRAVSGDCYKYRIESERGEVILKADPYAFSAELPPKTASRVYRLPTFPWEDGDYFQRQAGRDPLCAPINIYEVHLGSWQRHADGTPLSYREFADEIVPYLLGMHYTHLELLPITEYPYDPSWGYQVTGYFAPTARFGTPEDLMYLVNLCHKNGIGVILDFVGAHFPKDAHGLASFDGGFCYESSDTLMNEHPHWGTRIFDYSRYEVRSFLLSAVCFWLREYHMDGIRMDAVASMLYLDYGREGGAWHRNYFGGNHNLAAISLLQDINRAAFAVRPHVLMIAEESTAFPLVTRPPEMGGLGFLFKWNMGWMNDTLRYFGYDPLFRKYHGDILDFTFFYAQGENYVLPFSHDEVVHGKGSLIEKMPGNYKNRFAELRTLFSYMFAFPGKKLSFMGNDFAQFVEWNFDGSLDWFLKYHEAHDKMSALISALGELYQKTPALYEGDYTAGGFSVIASDDREKSIVSFRRRCAAGDEVIVVCNFCPVLRENYRIGIPYAGTLVPIFCSEDERFGGAGAYLSPTPAQPIPYHGLPSSAPLRVPPLSVSYYQIRKD